MQVFQLRYFIVSIKGLGLLLFGLAFSLEANASNFNVDPSSVSAGSNSFIADTLVASEASSNIYFTDLSGNFAESGFGYVTGALLNGSTVATNGLNSSYSLYFSFSDTGNVPAGVWNTGSFNFYAVSGKPVFNLDPITGISSVTNTGTPILLGTANLNSGTISAIDFYTNISAHLDSTFKPTADGAALLGLSASSYILTGAFSHIDPLSAIIDPANAASNPPNGSNNFLADPVSGVVYGLNLVGGYDTIQVQAIPEPAEWLLILLGLPMVYGISRRKQNSGGEIAA